MPLPPIILVTSLSAKVNLKPNKQQLVIMEEIIKRAKLLEIPLYRKAKR